MAASSCQLPKCTAQITEAVADAVISGAKPIQTLAIKTSIGCAKCTAFNAACVTSWLTTPIVPVDAAEIVVKSLRTTVAGRARLRREIPGLVHRLTAASEWSILADLCHTFPCTIAPEVGNTDDWEPAGPLPLVTLAHMAMAGVLGPTTLERSWATALRQRLTARDAVLLHRLRLYRQWLSGDRRSSAVGACAVMRATSLPSDVATMIARLAVQNKTQVRPAQACPS
jgi:hypothetical protein